MWNTKAAILKNFPSGRRLYQIYGKNNTTQKLDLLHQGEATAVWLASRVGNTSWQRQFMEQGKTPDGRERKYLQKIYSDFFFKKI